MKTLANRIAAHNWDRYPAWMGYGAHWLRRRGFLLNQDYYFFDGPDALTAAGFVMTPSKQFRGMTPFVDHEFLLLDLFYQTPQAKRRQVADPKYLPGIVFFSRESGNPALIIGVHQEKMRPAIKIAAAEIIRIQPSAADQAVWSASWNPHNPIMRLKQIAASR